MILEVRILPNAPLFDRVTTLRYNTRMKYTKEVLAPVIKDCINWSEVCRHFAVSTKGGGLGHIRKRAIKLGIDFSHFTGRPRYNNRRRGKMSAYKYSLGNHVHSHKLRLKLIEEGIKEKKCEICKLDKWCGKDIPLDLDHIDGNHFNNDFANLRILCKNCHAQTPTYGIKARKKKEPCPKCKGYKSRGAKTCRNCVTRKRRSVEINKCPCGDQISEHAKHCRSCAQQILSKSDIPSKDTLEKLVWDQPSTMIAKKYNVSDSAVGKWCKKYNISKPPRGYWAKKSSGKL